MSDEAGAHGDRRWRKDELVRIRAIDPLTDEEIEVVAGPLVAFESSTKTVVFGVGECPCDGKDCVC